MVAVTLVHHSQNSFEFVLQKEQRIFFSTLRLLLLSTTTSALGSIEVTSVKNILCARKEFVFDQLLPPIISDTLVTGMLGSVITIVRTKNTGLHSGLMPSKAELNALQSGSPTNCNPAANLTKHRGLCSWQPSLHCCIRTSVVNMFSDPFFQMLEALHPFSKDTPLDAANRNCHVYVVKAVIEASH